MELVDILNKINELRDRVSNTTDPVSLSALSLRMSSHNSYLGSHVADLEAEYRLKKRKVYMESLVESSATASELKAVNESIEEKRQYERVRMLHKDIGNLTISIQSTLKVYLARDNSQV